MKGVIELTKINRQFDNSGYMSKFVVLQDYLGFKYETSTFIDPEINLNRNKIDLSVPLVQSFERSKIVDFSQPFTIDAAKFIVGKPAVLSTVTAIVQPFLIHVWMAIFFIFVLSVIIFTLIFRKEAKLYNRKYKKINEIAWALFGSFTGQGNNLFYPLSKSCKLLVSGWILATFIITASYSGSLMSFITFPGRETVPRTYAQLVKMANNRDYIICMHIAMIHFISESTEGVGLDLRKLLESNKAEREEWLEENLANRIVKEKYAFIFYDNPLNVFTSLYGSENFLFSEDQLYSASVGFCMSKNIPYKKEINNAILRFVETGFWEKFKSDEEFKAEMQHPSIIQEDVDILHAVNVTDLAGPLLLLMVGYSLSIFVFFVELIVKKITSMNNCFRNFLV